MREYTGPTAATVASRLPGGTGRPDSAGRYRVRGFCHGHGDKRDSTSLSIQDRDQGGLLVTCFVGCDRQTIIAALERATGLTIWQAWPPAGATQGSFSRLAGVAPEPRKQRQRRLLTEDTDRIQMARGVWQSAVTVRAKETDHPAWHWLNARNLWRPEFPLPSCLRWLPASAHWSGRGQHTGAGSIVALVAPPWAWAEAWPGLPEPQSVELIAIKSNGTPALDRPANSGGLGKRTHGTKTGAVVVFGCPDLTLAMGPARVAEGVADALALASRYPGPAVATLGTSGMGDGELAEWLATCREGLTIHADADEAGERKARALRRQITREAGRRVAAVKPVRGKDAADAAAGTEFPPLPEDWKSYAATLQETTDWPTWEIGRQASTLTTLDAMEA